MFLSRTHAGDLDSRLDAEFYHPSFLENEERLHQCGVKLRTLTDVAAKLKCGPFGSSLHSNDYVQSGVPFVHPTCFSSGWLQIEKAERISIEDHRRLRSTQFIGPALVFARVGTPCCGVVPEAVGSFNIHGDVIGLQCKAAHDAHFVFSYFNSKYGSVELLRYQAGSTRPRTNTDILGTVLALDPLYSVQKYIGSKVRQAEQLNHESKKSIIEARLALEQLITNGGTATDLSGSKDQRHQRVTSAMIADRIDGWYYKPEFLRIEAALNRVSDRDIALVPIHQIGEVEYGFMPTEDYWKRGEGAPLLRVTNIKENLVVDTSDLEYVNPILSNKPRYRLRSGDVLCVQCGNSTGRIAYITDKFHNMVFPSFSLRVTNVGNDWDSGFLASFFASTVGQAQIQRTISITSVRPNTTKPAIEAVQVPKFSSNEQKRIGDAVRRGITFREIVDPLCNAAKFLVEALIEKKISESELEAAQDALNRGDTSLERAILKRLTVVGLDVAGEPPLLPDIDALYSAIHETRTALTTIGDKK
jgi:type I restriction enzyme S subunit